MAATSSGNNGRSTCDVRTALILGRKTASQDGLDTHHSKEVAGHGGDHCLSRLGTARHRLRAASGFCQTLQGTTLRADVLKVRIRKTRALAARIRLPEPDNLLRLLVRQRPQQDSVNHTEDGGGRTDSERQCEYSHAGEARVLAQLPQRKAHILESSSHRGLHPPIRTAARSKDRRAWRGA